MLHGLTAEVTLTRLRLPGAGNPANLMPPKARLDEKSLSAQPQNIQWFQGVRRGLFQLQQWVRFTPAKNFPIIYCLEGRGLIQSAPGRSCLISAEATSVEEFMTAHKRSGRKSPEEFWSKVLAAPKVKRILEKRGFDPEAFRRDYEADTTRGPRVPKRPTKQEMDAVEAFQRLGDFEALKLSLGTQSAAVANSALRRVLQFKALGGVKTVRRRSVSGA